MSSATRRTVVVGGGVIGVSTAQQLARAGAEVVLVTEAELVSNASGRSLSWLNSSAIRRDAYHQLRLLGIDRYRTLAAQQPGITWLRFDGGLVWQSEEKADELRRIHEHQSAHGYASRMVSAAEVADVTPDVDPAAIPASGAIWNPGEGWVDLPSLVRHLANDFIDCGGRLVTNAGPATVLTDGGSVRGVRTSAGEEFPAEIVVLATGSAVPAMVAEFGVTIPDATSLALLVTTTPTPLTLEAVLNTARASVRPTPDGSLAVDSDWTEADIIRRADGSYDVPPATVEALLAEASRLLEGNPRLEAARFGIGPKPVPGDGEPVLGRLDEVEGLYVAFTHSGATLGLIAGELLAWEMSRGEAHPLLAGFNPRRFRL